MVRAAVPSSYTIVFQFRAETLLPTTGMLSAPYKYSLGAVSYSGVWCCRTPEMRLESALCLTKYTSQYTIVCLRAAYKYLYRRFLKSQYSMLGSGNKLLHFYLFFFSALHVIIMRLLIVIFSTLA